MGDFKLVDKKELLDNIDKIHTTKMGTDRIRKNLNINIDDVIVFCKNIIIDDKCFISRKGKNWYCEKDNVILTMNARSYTIITAHIKRII